MVKKNKKNCNGVFLCFLIICCEDYLIVYFNYMFVFILYFFWKIYILIKENFGWYVKFYGIEICFVLFGIRL